MCEPALMVTHVGSGGVPTSGEADEAITGHHRISGGGVLSPSISSLAGVEGEALLLGLICFLQLGMGSGDELVL